MTLQATVHIPLGTTGPLEDWLPAALSRATAQGLPAFRRADNDSGLALIDDAASDIDKLN